MIDFLKKADFLKAELQEFYQALRRGGSQAARETAIARLRTAMGKAEAFAEDPGHQWEYLPQEQRWGYLQLVSCVGTASHELKKCGGQALTDKSQPR